MRIKRKVSLKKFSTFKIGGSAKFFCVVQSAKDLKKAREFAQKNNLPTVFLGGGSNVLFPDQIFDGLIIKIKNVEINKKKTNSGKFLVRAGAGTPLAKLVAYCLDNGLTGLEWAVGIPGSVGGAVRGNAGAFGSEIKDSLKSVSAINTTNEKESFEVFPKEECLFEYRNSVFKKYQKYVVWHCDFLLSLGNKTKSKQQMLEYLAKRKQKQPSLLKFPSAGSIFKNPVVSKKIRKQFEKDKEIQCKSDKVPAGWLIERCDLKKKRVGGAAIDDKQANFIINVGKATSEDVLILISLIKMKVRNQFGVQLEEEVQIIM